MKRTIMINRRSLVIDDKIIRQYRLYKEKPFYLTTFFDSEDLYYSESIKDAKNFTQKDFNITFKNIEELSDFIVGIRKTHYDNLPIKFYYKNRDKILKKIKERKHYN